MGQGPTAHGVPSQRQRTEHRDPISADLSPASSSAPPGWALALGCLPCPLDTALQLPISATLQAGGFWDRTVETAPSRGQHGCGPGAEDRSAQGRKAVRELQREERPSGKVLLEAWSCAYIPLCSAPFFPNPSQGLQRVLKGCPRPRERPPTQIRLETQPACVRLCY